MTLQTLVILVVVGGIAGFLAEAVVKGRRLGILGAVVVGVLGAFIGGWLLSVFGLSVGSGIIAEIITAFIGAVLLLLLLRYARRI
jgi:uncharacterized membrane protein YeaQ/YmgE (transglycosylase-associated protein family)